jgi:phosphoribosylformylglycinamidine synthase
LEEGLQVIALRDVKASDNQMYATKPDGEGAVMYDTVVALKDAMVKLEVAIDGGKDVHGSLGWRKDSKSP